MPKENEKYHLRILSSKAFDRLRERYGSSVQYLEVRFGHVVGISILSKKHCKCCGKVSLYVPIHLVEYVLENCEFALVEQAEPASTDETGWINWGWINFRIVK